MLEYLYTIPAYSTIQRKLYISCIAECPLSGRIDPLHICNEIRDYYENYDFTELCLSDTCGTLSFDDFSHILDVCIRHNNIDKTKISLHLHASDEGRHIVKRIIKHALLNGIRRFDVSILETGCCSATMRTEQVANNISYAFFYECLIEYIEEEIHSL
jgi:isopropylmalate/homocitrate/citramalate synthase